MNMYSGDVLNNRRIKTLIISESYVLSQKAHESVFTIGQSGISLNFAKTRPCRITEDISIVWEYIYFILYF